MPAWLAGWQPKHRRIPPLTSRNFCHQVVYLSMTPRTIIVGDVHGMDIELDLLLAIELEITKEDIVIFCGDLVDKGPSSALVVAYLRRLRYHGYQIILVGGNHEAKHAIFRPVHKRGKGQGMKGYAELARITDELSDADVAFLETAVLFHRIPEHNATVVHAGIPGTITELPEVAPPLNNRKMGKLAQLLRVRHVTANPVSRVTVEITAPVDFTPDMTVAELAAAGVAEVKNQVIKPVGSFIKLGGETEEDPFWADVYDGRFGHVYFGHSPFVGSEPRRYEHATGLDTGAVFGGHLTAAVLVPGQETTFVSVEAVERDNWSFAKTLYEE